MCAKELFHCAREVDFELGRDNAFESTFYFRVLREVQNNIRVNDQVEGFVAVHNWVVGR